MTGILEGVLEGDVFLGELAVEVGSICMRGYRRRGSGKRCLLRWRSMIGVLEDSCGRLACLRSWRGCS
jgi:hypothetical protein